jgi:hypothetical protein
VKIKIKKWVKIALFQLYHILECDAQHDCIPKNVPNKHMFFGTVVARGKSKNTWNVKWGILPQNNNIVRNITRTKLTIVKDGEEEKAIEDGTLLDIVEYGSDNDENGDSPEKSPQKESSDTFCNMDATSLKTADSYVMRWGKGSEDVLVLKILPDGESMSFHEDTLCIPEKVHYNEELWDGDLSELDDPADFFFKYIFPDITSKLSYWWIVISFITNYICS